MQLPDMKYASATRRGRQDSFKGLNHTLGAGDGEIWDMENLTSDHAPVLAVRQKRYLYKTLDRPGGIFAHEKLGWVDDRGFYYDGEQRGSVNPGKKQFTAMGNYIIILPDKKCYNVKTGEFRKLEAEWTGSGVTFGNGVLYEEDAAANMICCPGEMLDTVFKEGDAVEITGCTLHPENNKNPIIRAIDGDKLYFYEHVFTLSGEKGDEPYEEPGAITIRRKVPDLLFLCENENRLWGCDGDTIYASKLGDPFNWNVFDGLETDSWFVTPGSPGPFLGGIDYKTFAILFKADRIYKIYGSSPTSFTAVDSASLGLEPESRGSLAVAGEVLYYLSRNGIMAYTGGIPQPIGECFGTERFRDASGGSDGLKYYVSMQGEDGRYRLYVYDTQKGLWHIEDEMHITHFARVGGNLYGLTESGEIWILRNGQDLPEEVVTEEDIRWYAEFADFYEEETRKKEVRKIQIRLDLDCGAEFDVYMQFDSDGIWRRVSSVIGDEEKRSHILSVVPRRCDHYRIRLEGTGGCRVFAMTREYTVSSNPKSRPGRN